MKKAVLLVGHGSKDPEGNAEFEAFAKAAGMRYCMLDYVEPSLPRALSLLAAEGITDLAVIPYFLFAGGHVKNDIPKTIHIARKRYPKMAIYLGEHLGLEKVLLEVCAERCGETKGRNVLLVGRGSLHAMANTDMATQTDHLRTLTHNPAISHCFIALALPDLPTGIAAHRLDDNTPPIVVPYFLFTGILVKRIARIAHDAGCEVRPHLGRDARLIHLLHQRETEIWQETRIGGS
ncbi:Sirohydrochlorin cobaltochelatase CbiX(long) [hydrothermal vent metagenome]|uniref:Sirohydrochlorin cobaltochelatase CbiX(Long) n=1 Tax=hydrothermal vent metagenome TaxID=652676 RepID=A0A3B1CHX2_9ZZZZ